MEYVKEPKMRPVFPKRAVVTAGMPYGNKELHFGHVGGMFVFLLGRYMKMSMFHIESSSRLHK